MVGMNVNLVLVQNMSSKYYSGLSRLDFVSDRWKLGYN